MNIKKIIRRSLADLEAYQEPEPNGIKMHANTNLFEENPAIARAMKKSKPRDFRDYPVQSYDKLRVALARKYGVKKGQVVVGNGSDEIVDITLKTFINPGDRLVISEPTFSIFALAGRIHLADVVNVPLNASFQLEKEAVADANGNVTIICRPNNPTGACFGFEDVEFIIRQCEKNEGIVVVDEAYIEFADEGVDKEKKSMLSVLDKYENLIVTRTFSKAYGLAGLRIGYAITSEEIASQMNKVKAPYNLNKFSEAVALEALRNEAYVKKIKKATAEQRRALIASLEPLGITVYPSDANFVLARLQCDSALFTEKLKERGFLIRDLGNKKETENCVRITVAPKTIQEKFIKVFEKTLAECVS